LKFAGQNFRDSATLVDMQMRVSKVQTQVTALKDTPLTGGWQETLSKQPVEGEDGDKYLNSMAANAVVIDRNV